jgi:hypothetical protein
MPMSSSMHVPQLMGEDEISIKYGTSADLYDGSFEEKDLSGVKVKFAKRKTDGRMGVMECAFPKASFNADSAKAWIETHRDSFAIETAELFSVKDVEIFSVGEWNGNKITDRDLDNIVDAYSQTNRSIAIALKLGHDAEQKILQADGLPAAGWAQNVRKVGTKLVADFVDIPKKIYQLIKNKAYRKVSCEIYRNVKVGEQTFPRLLGAVSLLGADLPGVLNLDDILSMYSIGGENSAVQNFTNADKVCIITNDLYSNNEGDGMPTENEKKAAELQAELDKAKAEAEAYKKRAETAEAEKAETAAKLIEAEQKEKAAQVDKFVTELQADKLCSKAMAPFVKELLLEEKETYAIGDKKDLSKSDLVKEILKFSKEAAKVNFEDQSTTGAHKSQKDGAEDLAQKIEKYSLEHKVSYGDAYAAVTRGMKLDAKPMGTMGEADDAA